MDRSAACPSTPAAARACCSTCPPSLLGTTTPALGPRPAPRSNRPKPVGKRAPSLALSIITSGPCRCDGKELSSRGPTSISRASLQASPFDGCPTTSSSAHLISWDVPLPALYVTRPFLSQPLSDARSQTQSIVDPSVLLCEPTASLGGHRCVRSALYRPASPAVAPSRRVAVSSLPATHYSILTTRYSLLDPHYSLLSPPSSLLLLAPPQSWPQWLPHSTEPCGRADPVKLCRCLQWAYPRWYLPPPPPQPPPPGRSSSRITSNSP